MQSKKIMILANHDLVIYNFRKELILTLLEQKHEVYLVCPYGERLKPLIEAGARFIDIPIERHGLNPFNELKLFKNYRKVIQSVGPDLIMSNTIKPNLYSSMIAKKMKIPYVISVTGLGTLAQQKNLLAKVIEKMFQRYYQEALAIVVENNTIYQYFSSLLSNANIVLVGGSGVNLTEYQYDHDPRKSDNIHIGFIARIMKDKGIEEYLDMVEKIKKDYSNVSFHVAGFIDGPYHNHIQDFQTRGLIQYHGFLANSKPLLRDLDAVVLPSYHEGLSNILLEAAAMQRVVIASNIPGCKETFIENESGFSCIPKNVNSLYQAVVQFLDLSSDQRKAMGLKARRHVEQYFNRDTITQTYVSFLDKL